MRSHFAERGWIVISRRRVPVRPESYCAIAKSCAFADGRFQKRTFPRGELSTPADELAGVAFVQEALNRFEMGVILKK